MKITKTFATLAYILLASLMIVACSNIASLPQTNNQTGTTPTPSVSPSPSPTSTPSVIVNTPTVTSTSTGGETGAVTLTLDKMQYQPVDTITVTITNHLTQTVYINGRYYNCLPVQLEKLSNTTWVPLGNCNRIQVQGLSPIRIQAGTQIKEQLIPGAGITHPIGQKFWDPGTYRVTLSYLINYDPDTIGGNIYVNTPSFIIL